MKSYYQQVKKLTIDSGIVKHYRNDIFVHDRKMLRGYKGKFLYAFRECGTNLFKLDIDVDITFFMGKTKHTILKSQKAGFDHFVGSNVHFYYGYDMKVIKLTIDALKVLFEAWLKNNIDKMTDNAIVKIKNAVNSIRTKKAKDQHGKNVVMMNDKWFYEMGNERYREIEVFIYV